MYRRIPVLSIGRDVYNDTRIIIAKLEELFPEYRCVELGWNGLGAASALMVWSFLSS